MKPEYEECDYCQGDGYVDDEDGSACDYCGGEGVLEIVDAPPGRDLPSPFDVDETNGDEFFNNVEI